MFELVFVFVHVVSPSLGSLAVTFVATSFVVEVVSAAPVTFLIKNGFSEKPVASRAIFVPLGVFLSVLISICASGVFLGKLIFMFLGVRESVRVTSFSLTFSASRAPMISWNG